MEKQYGQKKGEDVYYGWLNKHGYDDSKAMKGQKSKTGAEAEAALDLFDAQTEPTTQEDHGQPATLGQPGDIPGIVPQPTPTGDPTKPQGLGEADTDRPITIAPGANDTTLPATGPYEPNSDEKMQETAKLQASADKVSFFSIPAYHFSYSAAPRIGGSSSEIGIKAIVLEEDPNVNNWEVGTDEFPRVAAQYKAGKPQLRVDHSKDVNKIIGKSVNGVVLTGAEIPSFMGRAIPGINPDGLYVGAEFVADPQDPQIRTNILNGYVVTGSIGLDAEAFCKECQTPLKAVAGEMKRQCAHLDAPIYLKNIDVKEWSYVAEPAYEHTQAFPSFAAAVESCMEAKEQTTKERNKLEEGEFAYPEERKLPINDAAHVRNALARWNQTDIPSDKKSAVLGRICRAAKKFGIESDLCKEKGKATASEESSLLTTPAPTIQMSTTVEATAAKKPPVKDGDEDDVDARAEAKFQQYKKAFAEGMKFRAKSESEGEGEAKAESEGEGEAKAESESEGEGEAKAESEGDAEAEVTPPSGLTTTHLPVKGARKTDQISKSGRVTPKANKVSYLEQALHPTDSLMASHPEMREIFKAAAEAPGAPEGARALRSRFT